MASRVVTGMSILLPGPWRRGLDEPLVFDRMKKGSSQFNLPVRQREREALYMAVSFLYPLPSLPCDCPTVPFPTWRGNRVSSQSVVRQVPGPLTLSLSLSLAVTIMWNPRHRPTQVVFHALFLFDFEVSNHGFHQDVRLCFVPSVTLYCRID